MEKHKRRLLAAVRVILVSGWLIWTPTGVNTPNALCLYRGIGVDEVEALLGSPGKLVDDGSGYYIREWAADGITVQVTFTADGHRMIAGLLRQKTLNGEVQYPLTELGNGEGLDFLQRFYLWVGLRPF